MKRGAQLSFEGGVLMLDLEGCADPGSGHFAFTDDELEPFAEFDEDGGRWVGLLAKLPSTELAAIRDFLVKHLPAESSASPSTEGSAPEAPAEPLEALRKSEGGA